MKSCKMLTVFLVLLFATLALGSTTGTISGIVTDSSGAVIPDAALEAVHVQTGVQHTVNTDSTKAQARGPKMKSGEGRNDEMRHAEQASQTGNSRSDAMFQAI